MVVAVIVGALAAWILTAVTAGIGLGRIIARAENEAGRGPVLAGARTERHAVPL